MPIETRSLLRKVASRMRLALFGVRAYQLALALAAVYGLLLLNSLLLDWQANWFTPITLVSVPVGATIMAVILSRRIKPTEAARLVDTQMATKDLFLTCTALATAPGDYKPLVSKQAQTVASKVRPAAVVPFRWPARTMRLALVLAVLLGATFLEPFDLFGHSEQRRWLVEKRQALRTQKDLAKKRTKVLRQEGLNEQISEQVLLALNELKNAFKRMKPDDTKLNLARLKRQQQSIGTKWRKASEQKLAKSQAARMTQQFGGADRRTADKWKQQLKEGSTSGLKQQMKQIRKLAEKLVRTENAIKQQQLHSQIQSQLQNLADFMSSTASSPSLNAQLMRAMEQLQLAGQDDLAQAALAAFDETMQLSELELESLAQSLRDLESLEKALEALQLAQQLNAQEPLDGHMCAQFQSISEYAEFYRQMTMEMKCAACNGQGGQCAVCNGTGRCNSMGLGMGGAGIGNIAPENSTAQTKFKAERSRSAMTAGKILMILKTQEQAPAGQADISYAEAVEQVKQGYSEAILQEQVPPGYHDAIRTYFDSLNANVKPSKTK